MDYDIDELYERKVEENESYFFLFMRELEDEGLDVEEIKNHLDLILNLGIQLPFKKKVLQYDFKIISDISLHIFRYRNPVTVPPPQEFPEQLRYLLCLHPPVRYQ